MEILARAGYYAYGRIFSLLWRIAVVTPGGNRWHTERAGDHPSQIDRPIWLHAASMGEVHVAAAYADALLVIAPLYLTVQTESGLEAAKRMLPHVRCAYAPFDTPKAVRLFLERINPRALVIFETEIWPYYLRLFNGPVWFANARLSTRSYRRYRKARPALLPLWKNVRRVFAQGDADCKRFAGLGLPEERIRSAGQVKQFQHVPEPAPKLRQQWRARLGIGDDESLWVAGSVRSDEVETILRLWHEAAEEGRPSRMVLAPRHLERVDGALRAARRYDPKAMRVSLLNGDGGSNDAQLFVLDSHGDLSRLYAAADLALLGGTFAPHGGHNPNEPAHYGVPVITGPHTGNIEADLPLLSKAGLCYRLANVTDFNRLLAGMPFRKAEEACARLGQLLRIRPKPAAMLADDIEAEFG